MTNTATFTDPAGLSGDVEETTVFAPKFNGDGLITAVATDGNDGKLLMLAYMNAEALAKTIETGEAWYWSRSRQSLWRKGETSGHKQKVLAIRTDCDQDAIELVVEQTGPACHTDRRSCFYREIQKSEDGKTILAFID